MKRLLISIIFLLTVVGLRGMEEPKGEEEQINQIEINNHLTNEQLTLIEEKNTTTILICNSSDIDLYVAWYKTPMTTGFVNYDTSGTKNCKRKSDSITIKAKRRCASLTSLGLIFIAQDA